jgi:hypothetical protein
MVPPSFQANAPSVGELSDFSTDSRFMFLPPDNSCLCLSSAPFLGAIDPDAGPSEASLPIISFKYESSALFGVNGKGQLSRASAAGRGVK